MTFGNLVEALGGKLGLELTDEGGATAVEVDGIPVILQRASDDLLLVHADLGEIAPDSRDRVLTAAMEANFLYQGTGGSTLAVDSGNGHLHLQRYNWLERLDAEKAVTGLTRFADSVKTWKELIAESAAILASESGGMPGPAQPLAGFMQV